MEYKAVKQRSKKGGLIGEDLENYSNYHEFYYVVFEYIKREENLTEEETKDICNVYEDIIEAEFEGGSSPRFTGDVILDSLMAEDLNESSQFLFSFDYNTDEDDVDYIQSLLKGAGVDAVAQPGLDSEEMVVKAKNAVELRKAKKVIKANGFEIYEALVNEAEVNSDEETEETSS